MFEIVEGDHRLLDLDTLAREMIPVIRGAITPGNAQVAAVKWLEQLLAPYEQQLAEARQIIRGYQMLVEVEAAQELQESIASRDGDAQVEQSPATQALQPLASVAPAKRTMFRWTPDMIGRLTTEFLASSQDASISAIASTIAERHHWPVKCVEYKIYQLGLPQQRQAQCHDEQDSSQVNSSTATAVPILEHEPEMPMALHVEVGSSRTLAMELQRGNYVWDGRVDGEVQRWYLDYPYGSFPAQTGGEVIYRGCAYVLQLVGTNTFTASTGQSGRSSQEMAQQEMK